MSIGRVKRFRVTKNSTNDDTDESLSHHTILSCSSSSSSSSSLSDLSSCTILNVDNPSKATNEFSEHSIEKFNVESPLIYRHVIEDLYLIINKVIDTITCSSSEFIDFKYLGFLSNFRSLVHNSEDILRHNFNDIKPTVKQDLVMISLNFISELAKNFHILYEFKRASRPSLVDGKYTNFSLFGPKKSC